MATIDNHCVIIVYVATHNHKLLSVKNESCLEKSKLCVSNSNSGLECLHNDDIYRLATLTALAMRHCVQENKQNFDPKTWKFAKLRLHLVLFKIKSSVRVVEENKSRNLTAVFEKFMS